MLPYAALRSLYFSLIHSRLQYGIEAWGNSNSIHKLLRVQKRAVRVKEITSINQSIKQYKKLFHTLIIKYNIFKKNYVGKGKVEV